MDEARVLGALLESELPCRLKERQALDVARYAADLAEDYVAVVFARAPYRRLDFVSDVRHDLHRAAEIAASPLAGKDGGVDAAGGVVARLGTGDARKTLVVPEVEIRLSTVVCHEHLAVLVGRHRAGIDIQVGVELLHEDLVAAALQKKRKRRAGDALAEAGNHPAGDEYVFDLLFHAESIS